jgi:hypothetical protein
MWKKISLYLALALFAAPTARAEQACQAEHLVVDFETTWDFSTPARSDLRLPTWSSFGLYETAASAHFSLDENQALLVTFLHEVPDGIVGLPYNIYHFAFTVGTHEEEQTIFRDFTANCLGPGQAMFPGSYVKLPSKELPARRDGGSRGVERVRIRIWGHL